jgi:hypothetical protein
MMRSTKKRCQIVIEVMVPNGHTESDIQQNIEAAAAIAGYNPCPEAGTYVHIYPPVNIGPSWATLYWDFKMLDNREEYRIARSVRREFKRRRAGRR